MIFLLTFPDVHASLECEKTFKRKGIRCEIDNVPANLGLSCGYAVRCEVSDAGALDGIIQENHITCSKIFPAAPPL